MKRILYILITAVTLFTADTYAQKIQFTAGAEGSLFIPAGSLADRFKPGMGFSLRFGQETSPGWYWFGAFEYINFGTENEEKLSVKRNLNVAGVPQTVQVPTPGIDMYLTAYGLSANAKSNLADFGFLKADIEFGFGVYRWEGFRGSFRDSIYYDTTGTGVKSGIEYISIAEIKQLDWSGGVNAGIGITIPVISPVDFYLGAHYKMIIGELWPALVLDMENVSVFQMYQITAGIRGSF
ncbi:MAG: hypothetical protein FMNOHCHN_00832 [Ignavibacteriaceae bacterium]|nr:hypothetical protein [Ignavibacteriaceae bacterium]